MPADTSGGGRPLPLPSFFDSDAIGDLRLPPYEEIAREAERIGQRLKVRPASEDETRIAVFGIDCQVGFCLPGASLEVPGALGDMRRAAAFILRNAHKITSLVFSLDTHTAFQVFHPLFWRDAEGNPPPPMTPIAAREVREGVWTPARPAHQELALRYCEQLEASGRYALTIWPYHTMLGSIDHALVPGLFEVAHYHTLLRDSPTLLETKGRHPLTENYSVLEPEVKSIGTHTVGCFNRPLLEKLLAHDRIYVFGEASSHCVRATLQSIQEALEEQAPERLASIHILADCMSPVPAVLGPDGEPIEGLDFPAVAEASLAAFEAAGMRVVSSAEGV